MSVLVVLLVLTPVLALGAVLMNLLFDAAPKRGRWPMGDARFRPVRTRSATCALCSRRVEDRDRMFRMALPGVPAVRVGWGTFSPARRTGRSGLVCQRCFDRGVDE